MPYSKYGEMDISDPWGITGKQKTKPNPNKQKPHTTPEVPDLTSRRKPQPPAKEGQHLQKVMPTMVVRTSSPPTPQPPPAPSSAPSPAQESQLPLPCFPGNHSNHCEVPPADLLEFYTFFAEVLMTLKKHQAWISSFNII